MMKLYFSPGACCMSCHIALVEAKIPFELVYVGRQASEEIRKNFLKVNPLGAVPALELENGVILTQNIAILEYVADLAPETGLIEKVGTIARAEIMKWLSLIASDLHKAFSPVFAVTRITTNTDAQNDIRKWGFANIDKYLTLLEAHLQNKTYLASERFTIADCYFYTVYQWTKSVSFPTEKFTAVNRYMDNIAKRPSVITVHEREAKASIK